MKLEEVAKKLGYSDVEHLKRNIEGYGSPIDKWWEVIEELVNELDLHFVISRFTDEQVDEVIHELNGYAQEYDHYEYGLPTFDQHMENMRNLVKVKLNGL